MQLTNKQLADIITWAKSSLDVEAVFLSGNRSEATARPDNDVHLALSITDQDPFWRLAIFLSHRRVWRAELEGALGFPVQLERTRGDPTPEAGYVEVWQRA